MAILGFEVEEIARLIALMEAWQWEEFVFEEGDRSLRLRGPRRKASAMDAAPSSPPAWEERRALPAAPDARPEPRLALTAPMMGVFYRAESPDAPPLAQVGERVSVGQTIGIIEAMKIFSEIPAEHAGIVVAILAEDGRMVQAGTPLILLLPE